MSAPHMHQLRQHHACNQAPGCAAGDGGQVGKLPTARQVLPTARQVLPTARQVLPTWNLKFIIALVGQSGSAGVFLEFVCT